MKQIFTLITGIALSITSTAQLVLNELYTDPGAGKHEFFELYNNSSSSLPMSLAGYSVITYFEGAGSERGFYVLDLPDLQVASKGYLVGSSANPFNCQGIYGSTQTQFSWNDIAFLNLNNGYLKKWVVDTTVPASIDGNENYDERPVPSDFNELFYRRAGDGASYNVFIYKNGNLVNAFFGGSNSHTVPEFITSMPRLSVELAGLPHGANIRFDNISSSASEHVIADAGSDNGFIRDKDGHCGGWGKSSAGVQHTPGETNGSIFEAAGSISIFSSIVRGTDSSQFSTLSYKLLSAAADALPVILDFYIDNGTDIGTVDSRDTYLDSDTIATVMDSVYEYKFKPYDAKILIAVKEAAGCYGKVFAAFSLTLLPGSVVELNGSVENTKVKLQWKISENEKRNVFEVQKSVDGSDFKTAGFMFASEKNGIEEYFFKGIDQVEPTAFYRLKIQANDRSYSYSKVIQLRNVDLASGPPIRLMNNPVQTSLGFTYHSKTNNPSEVHIYSMTGMKVYSSKLSTKVGGNNFTLNMGGTISAGIYLLEIRNGTERTVTKFIKR